MLDMLSNYYFLSWTNLLQNRDQDYNKSLESTVYYHTSKAGRVKVG